MQIEAPQRLSTAIIQLPTGDSVVEAMVDLQVEPPSVISWDQVSKQSDLIPCAVVVTSHPDLCLTDLLTARRLKAACATQTDGIQPMVTLDDCLEAEDICKADRGFQQLMRDRYDITDLATLACDPWYYGGRYSELCRLSTLPSGRCILSSSQAESCITAR